MPDSDFDELLAQSTGPRESKLSKRSSNREIGFAFDGEDDKTARFKIEPSNKNLSGSVPSLRNGSLLELDPASFKNEVQAYQERQKKKRLYRILGGLFVAIVFVWGITLAFPSNELDRNAPSPNGVGNSEEQRFFGLYERAPQANVAQMSLAPDGFAVNTRVGEGLGFTLTFTELEFELIGDCKVTRPADFSRCLATDSESPLEGYSMWLTKDAVRSSLFANAVDFEEVEVNGAATAAVMTLAGLSPNPRTTLVIVTPDVAGYIITLPESMSLADAKILASSINVE